MMETINLIHFWLSYSDKDNHFDRILVAVKNVDHFFVCLESDKLRLFLLLGGTLINDNKYLKSFENAAELIFYTEEQMRKLFIYFDKRRSSLAANGASFRDAQIFSLSFAKGKSCRKFLMKGGLHTVLFIDRKCK